MTGYGVTKTVGNRYHLCGSGDMTKAFAEAKRDELNRQLDQPKAKIYIQEHESTFGCYWLDNQGKAHFGWQDAPISNHAKMYLEDSSGYAVKKLLAALPESTTLVGTSDGAYGGKCNHVEVVIADLNAYAEKLHRAEEVAWQAQQDKAYSCHYCGCKAVGNGFFDEPVCQDCGG